jgi:elongation factor P--beta-lysine ligase
VENAFAPIRRMSLRSVSLQYEISGQPIKPVDNDSLRPVIPQLLEGICKLQTSFEAVRTRDAFIRVPGRDLMSASLCHVTPTFANSKLVDITRRDIQKWMKQLDLKPRTKKEVRRLLKMVLAEAVGDELIHKNPCHKIEIPRPDDAERRCEFRYVHSPRPLSYI